MLGEYDSVLEGPVRPRLAEFREYQHVWRVLAHCVVNNSSPAPGSILGVVTGQDLAEDRVCRANGTRVTESGARLRQRCPVRAL